MDVENVSFCAHADFEQTKDFIFQLKPKHVVLVHGEKHEAEKLKKEQDKLFPDIYVSLPRNGDCIKINWKEKQTCKIYGLMGEHVKGKMEEHKKKQIEKRKKYEEYCKCKKELEEEQKKKKEQELNEQEKDKPKEVNVTETVEETKPQEPVCLENVGISENQVDESKLPFNKPPPPPGKVDNESINENGSGKNEFYMTEEELENYIAVNISGVMLKKNFGYILLNEPDVKEFVGKDSISIDQKLHVKYSGTLILAFTLINEVYNDAEQVDYMVTANKKIKAIKLQKEIQVYKDDAKNELIFEWKSSKKNDIICDCLAYMMSQIPDVKDFDIFKDSYDENMNRLKEKYEQIGNQMKDALPDFEMEREDDIFTMRKGEIEIRVDVGNGNVVSSDNAMFRDRIQRIQDNY